MTARFPEKCLSLHCRLKLTGQDESLIRVVENDSVMIDQSTMLPVGTLLHGTYRVEEYLSSGGFGNTYVVTNVEFEEAYALKEFFMKGISQREGHTTVSVSIAENRQQFDAQKEKFKKEARRLRKLQSKHIVRVHDLFEENGTAYYVMDLIDGESLSATMKRQKRPLTEAEVWPVLSEVLSALKTVHSQQIWHLDLKPGNIMTDHQGRVVLIDFGASKQMDASQGYTGTSTALCYTPGYAPSEQIDGNIKRIGPWTDFYALGATLYNLLTNQQPPSTSDVMMEGTEAFSFPASASEEMRQLIVWLMSPRPASRPQSVEEIEQRLSAEHAEQPEDQPTVLHRSPKVLDEPEPVSEPTVSDDGVYEDPAYVDDESPYKYMEPDEPLEADSEESDVGINNNKTVTIMAVVGLAFIFILFLRAIMNILKM